MAIAQVLRNHPVLFGAALLAVVLLIAGGSFLRVKKVSPVGWGLYGTVHNTAGVALGGFDAVTYRAGTPLKGDDAFRVQQDGATWKFANAANQAAFLAEPNRFAPQFGGFCSFAVSKGFTATADPEVFYVDADKLYVFDSAQVKSDWLADLDANRKLSETNWAER